MGDSSYQYPVVLKWDTGPDSLKKLKNKLLLYFQSKSKSNGGECQIRDTDCSRGYTLIYFRDEAVRNQILQKNPHELKLPDGNVLELNVRLPEEQNSQSETTLTTGPQSSAAVCPVEKRQEDAVTVKLQHVEEITTAGTRSLQVLLENVQDSCSSDLLNLLVGNVSNKEEDTDFYVERIPEHNKAVITFTCDIDILGFIEKFYSHPKSRQYNMTVKSLEETKMIMAEGFSPNMSEEIISILFASPEYGDEPIEKVEMIPNLGAALITFNSEEVVKSELTKQRKINKREIPVYPYYPSIGECLYGKKIPLVKSPDPVEFPSNQYLLEFFLNNTKIKQDIENHMAHHHCEIRWPAEDYQEPVTLSVPSNLQKQHRKMLKIAPIWSKKVQNEFSLLMSKYQVRECDVKTSVWEAIKERVSSPTYNHILFRADLEAEKVFLVGCSEDLIKTESSFKDLVDKTARELMRVEDAVSLEPYIYEFLCLEKSLQNDSSSLITEYDSTTRKVKLCGTKDEVQNAKCEILKAVQELKSKVVPQDPHIMHFLLVADNQELSSLLFTNNNINVMMQVREKDVVLTASSEKDMAEAEKQMKELVCRRISIEDRLVIQIPEWDIVRTTTIKQLNAEKTTVVIEAIPVGAESEVVISGLSSEVQTAYQQIHQFLMDNIMVQQDIVVRSGAVMKFIEESKKEILDAIKKNVKILKKNNILSLSGPKQYVEKGEKLLRSTLSNLHSEPLYIDKPGAKKFCTENEELQANTMWTMFSCAIYLQKDSDGEAAALEMHLNEPHCRVTLPDGVTIAVFKDNPYHQKVGVAVIAASDDLKPIGGLVQTLLNEEVRTECESIIQKEGKLEPGDSMITDSGNLPCKQLIHAVSPKWDKKSSSKCERLLRKAIKSGLDLAAENGHSSIAISAASFAACGCPMDTCTECIVTSIKQHMESQQGTSSIRYIHLVDSEDDIIKAFTHSLSEEYEGKNVKFSSKQEVKKTKIQKNQKKGDSTDKFDGQMVTTKEGFKIKIIQGNIQDATTNVIVNSVGENLDLRSGAVSSSIFRKAGNQLQDLLNKEKPQTPVTDGCVFITEGCNLLCDLIIHCVVPRWDEGQGSSETIFRKIVTDCLRATEEKHMRSISFPAMGSGILKFPKTTAAAIMYEEVLNFSSKGNHNYIKEVTFMLHPSDTETIKAFSTELEKKTKDPTSQKKSDKSQGSFGPVTSPAAGVHKMNIGSVTYQVQTGDITKEDADVIVNPINKTFNLKSGVSKSILEEAGKDVEDECAQLARSKKKLGVTKGGNLSCQYIIHIVESQNQSNLKKRLIDALTECERLKAASVAFPIMCTDPGGFSTALVADIMLDAVGDFVFSKLAKFVQTVKVVDPDPSMLSDFSASMKNKEYKTSLFSWFFNMFSSANDEPEKEEIKAFELRENIEPVVYQICAENKNVVTRAKSWLCDLILKEQHENLITDDWILEFGDKDRDNIAKLQKSFQVTVIMDLPNTTIKVSGLTKDVLNLTNQIQDMINKVREKKTKEREAELCSNVVEWRYQDSSKFLPFDRIINLELENAKSANVQSLNIEMAGVTYTVVMELNCMRDPRGNEMKIQRFPKHENTLHLPSYWDPMNKTQLQVVTVHANSTEYSDVYGQFAKTCQMNVIKIERIQNLHLYQNYQIRKQSIDTKNSKTDNERQLFHGTDANTVKSVNSNGYNRSYSGLKVGALYGNGTYFAVSANYSSADQYSKPDSNGLKYMYLARVLTGEFCAGRGGMLAPPAKNPLNSTDLYDSVTDNQDNPSMFVIFNDIQAYPEYLITFSK